MTITVTHAKVSAKADSGDATLIQPSDWNDEHVVSGSAGLPLQLPIQNSLFYSPYLMTTHGAAFDVSLAQDVLLVTPFMASQARTWNRIGVNCSTGEATVVARLGIYESLASGMPGALLVDGGEVDLSTTGDKEKTISAALSANTVYWLALVSNNATTAQLVGFGDTDASLNMLAGFFWGLPASGNGQHMYPGFEMDHTYGALPADYDASSLLDNGWSGDPMPFIWLRTGV